jgi:NAD(P)H dehydrogenase (quinone)
MRSIKALDQTAPCASPTRRFGSLIQRKATRRTDRETAGPEPSCVGASIMKHAIILAHPSADSFAKSVADAYGEAVAALGHTSITRDLYRLAFDPCLKENERPDAAGYVVAADVARERAALADCDVFVLVYPIWFGTPPAMLKGYIERVFNEGFAFDSFDQGRSRPLLGGRKLISFTSSGSTKAWLEENGVWLSLRMIFDDYIAKLCGMTVADHVHFPSVSPGLDERWVLEHLETVRRKVSENFAGPA